MIKMFHLLTEVVWPLTSNVWSSGGNSTHNSPIYDECQTQSAGVLALRKQAHQEDSNNTPQPICDFQVGFPLLWIKAYPGLSPGFYINFIIFLIL